VVAGTYLGRVNLLAPFSGTLYMPDKEFLTAGSPVLSADGRPVAAIRWRIGSQRFEVADATGAVLAECSPRGIYRRRYAVRMRDGRLVVDLRLGAWRAFHGVDLVLASGQRLTLRRVIERSGRRFEFHGADGRLVGRISPTTGAFSFRPDSYALELLLPAMSALEAVALAQALRVAVRGMRRPGAAPSP
jgi:hypothetical protein